MTLIFLGTFAGIFCNFCQNETKICKNETSVCAGKDIFAGEIKHFLRMEMKKIILLAGLVLLAACQKETECPQGAQETGSSITFELTADYSGATKAVKTGWEAGDVIFVFFEGAQAPRHLQMRYDGTSWTCVEMNGENPESLGLQEGNEGTMRAIYLPFGNDSQVDEDFGRFLFSSPTFADNHWYYYLTATLHYEVRGGKVSGAFNMSIPEGWVQFWIEDASATGYDDSFTLKMGAINPRHFLAVEEDLSISTYDSHVGYELWAYPYKGGWLFSGLLDESYLSTYGNHFYFSLTKYGDDGIPVWRKDLFVSGKTLESHNAVRLPAIDSPRWQLVGPEHTVELIKDNISYGEWHTCNYGANVPEERGRIYDFNTANSLGLMLPSKDQWLNLTGLDPLSFTPLSHAWIKNGYDEGRVIWGDSGFIFLPSNPSINRKEYWISTPGWAGLVTQADFGVYNESGSTKEFMIRPMKSPTTPTFNAFHTEVSY